MTQHPPPPPSIAPPWYEPLALFDAYMRLTSNRDPNANGGMTLTAIHPSIREGVHKGVPRERWLRLYGILDESQDPSEQQNPIVTVVPHYQHDNGLSWRPLRFSDLPRWLKQFDDAPYHPANTTNTAPFLKLSRQLAPARVMSFFTQPQTTMIRQHISSYRLSGSYAANVHAKKQFAQLMTCHLHPDSEALPLDEWSAINPRMLAHIFLVERNSTQQHFAPMVNYLHYPVEQHGHLDSNTNAWIKSAHRREWRQVKHHGFHPDQNFYGKRWHATRSSPSALYAGIELEMELNGRGERDVVAALFNTADEFGPMEGANGQNAERLHIERDGSITGLEAPLMPHEIGSHHAEQFWRKIWHTVTDTSASNDDNTCGMHIHVNADTALHAPESLLDEWPLELQNNSDPMQYYRETAAFYIDIITNMLAGGPHCWNFAPGTLASQNDSAHAPEAAQGISPMRNNQYSNNRDQNVGQRQDTSAPCPSNFAFGRHRSWHGNYAALEFSLCRKDTHLYLERYRAVNWMNKNTIEFRLFGPQGFDASVCKDWLNVSTQFTAAIVAFSRVHAQLTLNGGLATRTQTDGEAFVRGLPSWLQPLLLVEEDHGGVNYPVGDEGTTTRQHERNEQAGVFRPSRIHHGPEFGLAVTRPGHTSSGNAPLWLVGTARPSYMSERGGNSVQQRTVALKTLFGDAEYNKPFLYARRAQLYASCCTLWREMLEFMRNEAPQFDIALAHLEAIEAWLPNAQQMQQLAAWNCVFVEPQTQPLLDTRRVGDWIDASRAVGGSRQVTADDIRTAMRGVVSGASWQTDVFSFESPHQ